LNRQVQVSELAEEAGLSERHFSRLFRSAYGQPPISYAADLRLERARELLNSGSLVLEEIAERTGYSDAAHLCRVFQTAYGCTPSHFRRAPPTAVHGVFDNRG
jgi:AraC family transcriptional regulator